MSREDWEQYCKNESDRAYQEGYNDGLHDAVLIINEAKTNLKSYVKREEKRHNKKKNPARPRGSEESSGTGNRELD